MFTYTLTKKKARLKMKNKINHEYTKHVVCPHCGYIDTEITEMFFDNETLRCENCGKEFGCTAHTETLFVTFKKESEVSNA